MPKDETTLKCTEVSLKEPKTWAWIAAIVTSLLMFFVSFSVLTDANCTGTFFFALVFGAILLCLAFLCILRCCSCSSNFAKKVTPYTQNYWFKGGVYAVVGILGIVIYATEGCPNVGIIVIYVISILAGILFLVLGFINRGKQQSGGEDTDYTASSATTDGGFAQ